MKTLRILILGVLVFPLLMDTGLFALGFGLSGNFGYSSLSMRVRESSVTKREGSGRGLAYGGGLVFDTIPTEEVRVSYRLNLGYQRFSDNLYKDINLHRINIGYTVCVALIKTNQFRLWLGPQVGFHYIWGNKKFSSYSAEAVNPLMYYSLPSYYGSLLYVGPMREKITYNFPGISAAADAGVNIKISQKVMLSIDGGMRYLYLSGQVVRRVRDAWAVRINNFKDKSILTGFEGFAGLSFIYCVDKVL